MFAQTVVGKFDHADLLFLIAFILGCVVVVADVVRKADLVAILWRVAIVLVIGAFWVS